MGPETETISELHGKLDDFSQHRSSYATWGCRCNKQGVNISKPTKTSSILMLNTAYTNTCSIQWVIDCTRVHISDMRGSSFPVVYTRTVSVTWHVTLLAFLQKSRHVILCEQCCCRAAVEQTVYPPAPIVVPAPLPPPPPYVHLFVLIVILITARECGVVLLTVASVCTCVCLSVLLCSNLWKPWPKNFILAYGYIFRICRLNS